MDNTLSKPKLILASASPRRRDLLTQAGLTFTVIPSTIDETAVPPGPPEKQVLALARAKAEQVACRHPRDWVIGADTMVVIDGQTLGKPHDKAEARSMLERLSGNTHKVFTGYCICRQNGQNCLYETVETRVYFKSLATSEIEWYIGTEEPYDKAGGYAAQGLGTFLIQRIEGSYTNIVGLPVCEVMSQLIKEGVVQR